MYASLSDVSSRSNLVSSVYDLLELRDEDFVRAAYRSILHRDADEAGLAHYLLQLRGGIDRRYVLADFARSGEGRRSKLPGLKAAIRSIEPYGKWSRVLSRGKPDVAMQLSALQNMHYVSEARLQGRIDALSRQMDEEFGTLRRSLLVSTAGGSRAHAPVSALHEQILRRGEGRDLAKTMGGSSSSRRVILFYVDHTVNCPVNTGMQRLVRQLARGLVENGERIRFVKWVPGQKKFALINKFELNHLSGWNGPKMSAADVALYPDPGHEDEELDIDLAGMDCWFIQPEVTHITYHDMAPTVDAFLAARALGAKLAAVYYDAIPLRVPEYSAGLDAHEKYMQALLLVDLVIPISERSAEEIRLFFSQHQHARTAPKIQAILLPGETNLTDRIVDKSTSTDKVILSVGSLEPRKNHARLLAAFQAFSEMPGNGDWSLILAGNMHPDVAPIVEAAIKKNAKIQYIRHPSDTELDQLYQSARFTVFPSTEEGFGLPILESIWYSVPCVCANFGAMAEVAKGGGALTVDTRNTDDIRNALVKLTGDQKFFAELKQEASERHIKTWNEYSREVLSLLTETDNVVDQLGAIYYWINDTAVLDFNTGIQRVVRQTARALMAKGVDLIPVRWDRDKKCLIPATAKDLANIEKWNGPKPDQWAQWCAPSSAEAPQWLMVPEVVHLYLDDVVEYAAKQKLRTATIFFDAIPYKMRNFYSDEWHVNHKAYMEATGKFDKIFPISHTAKVDLEHFLLSLPEKAHSIDHRLKTIALACELTGQERNTAVRRNRSDNIQILSVGSLEPRKNHVILLEAFARASLRSSKRLFLKIVGNASSGWPAIAESVKDKVAGLQDCEWLTDVDDEQLGRYFEAADFTVYPSIEEGFGLPIVESIWNGRPCITHDKGSMAEIAADGGCLSIDMGDVQALTEAILEMAENEALRRDAAIQAVERPLRTWEDYAEDIVREMASDRLAEHLHPLETQSKDVYSELPGLRRRPLLSLCISTYNRAGWLGINLRNIFSQIDPDDSDLEVLVVDNTSTDNSEEIVQPFLKHKNFRYVRNIRNVGMLGNLTVTAHEARGEYVWILGDDDLTRKDALPRVLKAIKDHPGVALVYPNYAYTFETDPGNAGDIEAFLEPCPAITPPGPDLYATVKEVAVKNENLFTAIYALILRRDHALRAYSQDTSGRDFSTMRTAIPTTYYVLHYMIDESAYWIGDPVVVVNFNVSWNRFAPLFILERFPEAHDLAERLGSDGRAIDDWRTHLMPGFPHWWSEIFGDDPLGNANYFSPERVIMRVKHLEKFEEMAPQLRAIYHHAHMTGKPAAGIPTDILFSSIPTI